MDSLLKLTEVAERLDVSEKTVRRYVKSGVLPSSFVGNSYRVTEADIDEFLRASRVGPGGQRPKVQRRSELEPSFNDVLQEERRETLEDIARDYGHNLAEITHMCERFERELNQVSGEAALVLVDSFFWQLEGNTTTRFDAWLRELERLAKALGTTDDAEALSKHSVMLKAVSTLNDTAGILHAKEVRLREEMGLEVPDRPDDVALMAPPPRSVGGGWGRRGWRSDAEMA